MRGQSQVVGFTIITLIMLSITSIVFLWGQPLIERSSEFNEIDKVENQMIKLNKAITQVAYDKSQKTINFKIDSGSLIWEKKNRLNYYSNSNLPYTSGEKIIIEGSLTGIDNTTSSSPCYNTTINGSIGNDDSYCLYKQGTNFQLYYPVLNDSSGKCFSIRLIPGRNAGASAGDHEIELKYNQTNTIVESSLDNGCTTIYKPEIIFNIK